MSLKVCTCKSSVWELNSVQALLWWTMVHLFTDGSDASLKTL